LQPAFSKDKTPAYGALTASSYTVNQSSSQIHHCFTGFMLQ